MNPGARPGRASLADLPQAPAERTGWPWTEASPALPATRPDGSPWPRISIITPVYNQAHYLEETLRSVLLQGYPELEYIVVNDGSTDDSEGVLRRYAPWLAYWTTQVNQGQRAALNNGFQQATGQVQAYLNSDDLLLPGALERAALELDPRRGRHVVMGRCRFTDPEGRFIGVEHPSRFESHRRVLEVWKGHTIPQPSVFWTPEVWRTCGPIQEELWVDYGLFCRFSRRYRFHEIDQVMSTYRLHPESKTQVSGEERRLREVLPISRQFWGALWSPRRWRLEASLWAHRRDRRGRALQALRAAREAARQGQPMASVGHALRAAALSPAVTFKAGLYPELMKRLPERARRALERLANAGQEPLETRVYLQRTEPWSDGWAGPRLVAQAECQAPALALRLSGFAELRYVRGPLTLVVRVDGRAVGTAAVAQSGDFELRFALPEVLPPGSHQVTVEASTYFVPHRFLANADHRPLSFRLALLEFSDQ